MNSNSERVSSRFFGSIGRLALRFYARRVNQAAFAGRLFLLGIWGLKGQMAKRRLMRRLILSQVLEVFFSSVLLLVIFGLIMGVLWTIIWFGVLANIGGAGTLITLLIKVNLVEISPILTTLVVIMTYGGPMTLELSLAKSSGQFETLISMGIPPEHLLAWPRIFGLLLAFPGLLLVMNLSTWLGAYLGIYRAIDLPLYEFAANLYLALTPLGLLMLAVKCLLIGASIGFFCLYNAWQMPGRSFRLAPQVSRRAMCEAFVFSTLAGVLVTVLYG
ncbi:MAG: ABC transporter permease [Deltaproteobacteria bacterium]|nr:ABC transporter permease [Deltaproteobacteria bacterium]